VLAAPNDAAPAADALRRRAQHGDAQAAEALVPTLLTRYARRGDGNALLEAFDWLGMSWAQGGGPTPDAAAAYVARYCNDPALAGHPFCNPAE
jgi:hypothetical protein